MTNLESYRKRKEDVARAKAWLAHLTKLGWDSKPGVVHSIGAAPIIAQQYTQGAKNYWEAKADAGEEFIRQFNAAVSGRLCELSTIAIHAMEVEVEKLKAAAQADYKMLFDEDLVIEQSQSDQVEG